jgi:hypothetical protein
VFSKKAEAVDLRKFPIVYNFQNQEKINSILKKIKTRDVLSPLSEIYSEEHLEIDIIVNDHLEISPSLYKSLKNKLEELITTREKKAKTSLGTDY